MHGDLVLHRTLFHVQDLRESTPVYVAVFLSWTVYFSGIQGYFECLWLFSDATLFVS